MPTTRSGAKGASSNDRSAQKKDVPKPAGTKRKQTTKEATSRADTVDDSKPQSKPGDQEEESNHKGDTEETRDEPPKKAAKHEHLTQQEGLDNQKLDKLIEEYGAVPLADYGLEEPDKPTAATVLAHLLNAMLTSARISHQLASKSVKTLIEAGYHDIETLKKSSWEERTELLTKGGYTRYREKTATGLGELVEFLEEKYGGDLNKLREEAGDDPGEVRRRVKEIKGLGEVGAGIFSDTIQAVWPCMAPYLDSRNLDTAAELGVGKDVEAMWEGVGKDHVKMAKLCAALTTIRLEKKQEDFKDDEDEETK